VVVPPLPFVAVGVGDAVGVGLVVGGDIGDAPTLGGVDPDAVAVARPSFAGTYAFETVLKQAAPPSSRVSGSLGAARLLGDVGVALVSPKGLLEFSSSPLQ